MRGATRLYEDAEFQVGKSDRMALRSERTWVQAGVDPIDQLGRV